MYKRGSGSTGHTATTRGKKALAYSVERSEHDGQAFWTLSVQVLK